MGAVVPKMPRRLSEHGAWSTDRISDVPLPARKKQTRRYLHLTCSAPATDTRNHNKEHGKHI